MKSMMQDGSNESHQTWVWVWSFAFGQPSNNRIAQQISKPKTLVVVENLPAKSNLTRINMI